MSLEEGPMIALLLLLAVPATAQPRRDFATLNVCQLVPGEAIARALGAKLVEARPVADQTLPRCRYSVLPAGSDSQRGYVVWIQQPEDFEELKKVISDPITTVSGLGDGAYLFRDKGDGRFKIHVLKRGDLMFEATGDSAASARKVADAVVAQLWK
jgi:hypothetical protein